MNRHKNATQNKKLLWGYLIPWEYFAVSELFLLKHWQCTQRICSVIEQVSGFQKCLSNVCGENVTLENCNTYFTHGIDIDQGYTAAPKLSQADRESPIEAVTARKAT